MTPNEIATIVAEKVNRQLDVPFKLMVFDIIKTWRSTLIKNTLQKTPQMKNSFMQSLMINTVPYSSAGCDLPACYDSAITTIPVPQSIRTGNNPYDYVGGVSGTLPYAHGTPTAAAYMKEGKYSKKQVWWYKSSDKIILSNAALVRVRIDDVFDDPLEVKALQCKEDGKPCDSWNEPYPGVTLDILEQAIKYTVEYLLQSPITKAPQNEEIKPSTGTETA